MCHCRDLNLHETSRELTSGQSFQFLSIQRSFDHYVAEQQVALLMRFWRLAISHWTVGQRKVKKLRKALKRCFEHRCRTFQSTWPRLRSPPLTFNSFTRNEKHFQLSQGSRVIASLMSDLVLSRHACKSPLFSFFCLFDPCLIKWTKDVELHHTASTMQMMLGIHETRRFLISALSDSLFNWNL